jgi:predicted permease
VINDVKYGIRRLTRGKWSTVITILSLALGIGVNTALITAYEAFFARPLDARNANEMVNVALTRTSGEMDYLFSYSDFETYRDSVNAAELAAFRVARVQLSSAGAMIAQRAAFEQSTLGKLGVMALADTASNAEFAQVLVVSDNYFSVLGVSALQGRTFEDASTDASGSPAVLISENFWQRRFQGDPAIVGRVVNLNGVAVTIIGITPRDFVGTFISAPAFWLPLSIEPLINGDSQWLVDRANRPYRLFGRLARGASVAPARTQIGQVAEQLWALDTSKGESNSTSTRPTAAMVWPGSPFPYPPGILPGLNLAIGLILFGGIMLLAIACANVGSLQLARVRSREMELRTRFSLGASRVRIIRQLLTESALMGIAAGLFALLFSWALLKAGVRAFADAMPVEFGALVFDVNPNIEIFGYILLISLIAGILSGVSPAMQSPRSALTSVGRGSTVSVRGRRLQGILVAVQVALSLVLLITGSMFVRGAINSLSIETGYAVKQVVQLGFQFPKDPKYTEDRRIALVNELRFRLAALPGVTAVTSAQSPGNAFRTGAIPVEKAAAGDRSFLFYTYVQPGYFETLGIPLVHGRGFEGDAGAGQFAVLSESAARRMFGNENPLGRRVRLGFIDERLHLSRELVANGPTWQIAGIARDTRGWTFDRSDTEQIFLPLPAASVDDRPLLIRAQQNALSIIRSVEQAAASVDPAIVVTTSKLEDALRRAGPFMGSSMGAAIASGIGMLGLLLAVIGILGTVSHVVALRTRELGIRMAIGAQRRDVLRLVLREITRPVVAGLIAGMLLAVGLVYGLRGMFYGIRAVDGIYFAMMSLLFLIVALLAAYPPARRAMKVDPVVALRSE